MTTLKQRAKYWSLGAALLPFAITQVLAQTTTGGGGNATTLDTVQVSGVRSSLQKSQIIKQDFIGTVDAVSAEDVGKFPDQNVADALQRVPGVSVDRSGGESRFITVRGFGPEFNVVTFNGRTMATENEGREFSFDILPSELISAAEVQKTSMADSTEGSIGATVNIRTQRPLDNPGLHVAATVAGVYDSMSKDTKPKVSGLISKTNADGTLGGLLSVVHYQRSHIGERVTTEGWLHGVAGLNGIALPRNLRYDVNQEKRTRSGVNAALDWHPSDTIKLGVDAMYSRYKLESDTDAVGFFTDPEDIIDIRANENNTATWYKTGDRGSPIIAHTRYSGVGSLRNSTNTNQQFGANLDWQLSEQTILEMDGSWSKAESDARNVFANLGPINTGVTPEWNLNPGAFPTYSNLVPITGTSDLRVYVASRSSNRLSDDIREFKTQLSRSFYDGVLSRLQFGASGSTRTKQLRDSMTVHGDLGAGYYGSGVLFPARLVRVFNGGNVAGAGGPSEWLTYDPNEYMTWLESEEAWGQLLPGGSAYNPADPERAQRLLDLMAEHGGGFNPVIPWPLSDWKVREKNYAAFAQADFEGDWGAMPWKLNVGVRYIRTDLTSEASSAQVASITPDPIDPTIVFIHFTEPLPLTKHSRYHDWLPSLNFRLNLRDDLVLRASASKTVTRPTLTNLRANESIGARAGEPGIWNTGNPDLKPYTAKNVDLGLEWYINDTSYIALAGFYKNVSNFVAMITQSTAILDHPFMRAHL